MTLRLPRAVAIPLAVHGAFFTLVIFGFLPREAVLYETIALILWAAWTNPRNSVVFFAASIPLFIAVPLTADFDNFNQWRVLALVIAVRWFLQTQSWRSVWSAIRAWIARPLAQPIASALVILAILSVVSIIPAQNDAAAIRRIVYFVNAFLVPWVAFFLARTDRPWRRTLMAGVSWSAVIIVVAAFVQLASTYMMDIYAFMRVWGEQIQFRQFGAFWSYIVVDLGNTWFAYYGAQLSLRVFSLFPDSHSFPLYLILALGPLIALSLAPITQRARDGASMRQLLRTRATLAVAWVPFALLAMILSGTRGIWAASLGLVVVLIAAGFRMRLIGVVPWRRRIWQYLGWIMVTYVLLFAVAWPIFVSPQFLLSKGDWGILGNRFRSIIDFGETSNSQRIAIWSSTVQSIAEHPIIGIGIGNFPTVLRQDVILAKAGSSAHNVWLHVAAELGVFALVAFAVLWIAALRSAWHLLMSGEGDEAVLGGWLVLAIPWAAAYLLTDAALFDERALLMFGIIIALVRAADPRTT
ncbi:MAG TPA: O-antigen ligase family protein [Candidatus Paceibacterota bacterium]|nr:O-antigen ligase family protein [Candidatus Paceibacterota bacterium]